MIIFVVVVVFVVVIEAFFVVGVFIRFFKEYAGFVILGSRP
jgi:hypothetical protein